MVRNLRQSWSTRLVPSPGKTSSELHELLRSIPRAELIAAYREYRSGNVQTSGSDSAHVDVNERERDTSFLVTNSISSSDTPASSSAASRSIVGLSASPEIPVLPSPTTSNSPAAASSRTSQSESGAADQTSCSTAELSCLSCRKAFETRPSLNKHINTVHNRRFPCTVRGCEKGPFGLRRDLIRHVETVHDRNTMICLLPDCGTTIAGRLDNFHRHLRDIHKIGVREAKAVMPIYDDH